MDKDRGFVNASSNLDLKTELLKLKQTFDSERVWKKAVQVKAHSNPLHGRRPAFRCKPEVPKDSKASEEPILEKSRISLAQKAALYTRLQQNPFSPDSQELLDEVLVDFTSKERPDIDIPMNSPDGIIEWIECVDDFGRTRFIRKDQFPNIASNQRSDNLDGIDQFPSKDYCKQPEIRTKSVGFFKLSTSDSETRRQQLKDLSELHSNTLETRARNAIRKDQKRLLMEERLILASKRRNKR